MRHLRTRRPSAAIVVALIALVFGVAGTAFAAGRLVRGESLIEKASLSRNGLRNPAPTGTQINLNRLAKVPSSEGTESGTTATKALTAIRARRALTANTGLLEFESRSSGPRSKGMAATTRYGACAFSWGR
jgi:hypothetical protein